MKKQGYVKMKMKYSANRAKNNQKRTKNCVENGNEMKKN